MDTLLAGDLQQRAPLDGVLSPNDTLARAIITSVKAAGKPIPVVTGQDSEVESVKSIMAGEQYSTINKDTRKLVSDTINMVKALQAGKEPEDQRHQVRTTTASRSSRRTCSTPVIVTKANAAEAYANDPTLLAIVNAAG